MTTLARSPALGLRPAASSLRPRGAPSSFSSSSATLPQRSGRAGRRRAVGVVAFRWGDDAEGPTSTQPRPPKVSGSSSPFRKDLSGGGKGLPADEGERERALEEVQRQEQVREAQAAASEVLGRATRWLDAIPDKRTLLIGGAGAAVLAYLGSSVVAAVDRVPVLPGIFEAVGFGYSAFFFWKYVLFAKGREELRMSLRILQKTVVESVDDFTERTLDTHPAAGGEPSGPTARGLVEGLAARHASRQRREQQQRQLGTAADDGSWIDEQRGDSDATEEYVKDLLTNTSPDNSSSSGTSLGSAGREGRAGEGAASGSASPPRGPPALFLVSLGAGPFSAPELGPDEAAASGSLDGARAQQRAARDGPSAVEHAAGRLEGGPEGGVPMDPCLGWDTEACAASQHLQLGTPDQAKLDRLAEEASRTAREATGFSKHVDQKLHEPSASYSSSDDLQGRFGRTLGDKEREEMERMAQSGNNKLNPSDVRSMRQPSGGEETGTGPSL
ncbi:hypothetical protein HYH03_018990 [Edaphochlamys debaryana]|uniref:Cyanobacterial aminoacyl-tRNA synthetase CAAD domain-containing protein n=1 Tax=Edaphochlamys debaryana TaxID=47281 RepID=A0A835XEU8_9CHLO|nr:hypothetical protein HYH03_018990 [Edaphochlamys debaryana]|eukprot:KAG2482054.1 hypothetical protein HYH03_018990 [Edaphochlamys debaryana]